MSSISPALPHLTQTDNPFRVRRNLPPLGLGVADPRTGQWLDVNDTLCQMLGYRRAELLAKTVYDVTHPEDREACTSCLIGLHHGQTDRYQFDSRYQRHDGTSLSVALDLRILHTEDGAQFILSSALDLGARVLAEPVPFDAATEFTSDVANGPGMLYEFVLEPGGRLRVPYTSRSLGELIGISGNPGSTDTPDFVECIHADDVSAFLRAIRQSAATLAPVVLEFRVNAVDGLRWLRGDSRPERRTNGDVHWYGILSDITALRVQRDALGDGEPHHRFLFEHAADGIIVWDTDSGRRLCRGTIANSAARVREREALDRLQQAIAGSANGVAMADTHGLLTYVNPAFLALWGYSSDEELLGRSALSFWRSLEEAQVVVASMVHEGSWTGELTAQRADGDSRVMELNASIIRDGEGSMIGMLVSFVDVTEARQLEEELRQSLKLDGTGQRTDGTTPDFSNLLSVIKPSLDRAFSEAPVDRAAPTEPQDIAKGVDSAARLTQQLLQFLRNQVDAPATYAGNHAVPPVAAAPDRDARPGERVDVTATTRVGTTIVGHLPVVAEPIADGASPESPTLPRGTEVILLVEDDPAIRQVMSRLLVQQGYRVVAFDRGPSALNWLGTTDEPVDLLLTDVVMPGMNGRQLADEVQVTHPEIPVLYASGYTANVIAQHGVVDPETPVLPKPFAVRELVTTVRATIDRARPEKLVA